LGTFGGHSNFHMSKTMNFFFSQNTLPSHLPKPWHTDRFGHVQNTPNLKHWCTKNLMVLIWGTWRHSHLYISKTMNFIFSQNTPPSHLPKSWHIDQPGHVQNTSNSKHWCTKNFMVLIWGHSEAIPNFTSQKPWISFFHKTPHQAIYLSRARPTDLAMCKTHLTQNIGAPRILYYSFGAPGGHSNLYISKTMNFIFSQNTPPSHRPKLCHTDQLSHVQNTSNSKHLCTKNFMVLIWGHL